jgi:farnesyl-diphosphate farnesyltransferase
LRRDSVAFGEGLQLVNILKDRVTDAGEGRYYLPENLSRAEVFALARRDLMTAAGYSSRLERAGSDRGIVAFTALPVLLARATLDRVEQLGSGAKISRDEVARLVRHLHEALERSSVERLLETSDR